jgi:hypothetical protein
LSFIDIHRLVLVWFSLVRYSVSAAGIPTVDIHSRLGVLTIS